MAERRKRLKYAALEQRYLFEPIAVETTGVFGKTTSLLINDLGRRLQDITGDPRESLWLKQRIQLAVLRGNATSILAASNTTFDR